MFDAASLVRLLSRYLVNGAAAVLDRTIADVIGASVQLAAVHYNPRSIFYGDDAGDLDSRPSVGLPGLDCCD